MSHKALVHGKEALNIVAPDKIVRSNSFDQGRGRNRIWDKRNTMSCSPCESSSGCVTEALSPVGEADFNLEDSDVSIGKYSNGQQRSFCGLYNQGATCYLNSLLQTLYMTPEFRRLIYSWHYNEDVEGSPDDSIPFQLQKLFGLLQLSSKSAISTKQLTKSFQWDSLAAFEQHDVQELMRVLFDALERSLKLTGHPTPDMINEMFEGELLDYLRAILSTEQERQLGKSHLEKQRKDFFQDLSLVIKPFGASKALKSIEEALREYIKPELLDESNAVYFEELHTKLPARKGLAIAKPPYILTLQLKRFDLDYTSPTLDRVKLNDRVTFPFLLDFNPYVDIQEQGKANSSNWANMTIQLADGKPETFAHITGENTEHQLKLAEQSYDTFLQVANDWIQHRGAHIYELYSVLVHSGSALGGHYLAYIKNLDTGKWFEFNDSTVSKVSPQDVMRMYGRSDGMSPYYGASAYMLVYRKVLPNHTANITTMSHSKDDNCDNSQLDFASLSASHRRTSPSDTEVPAHIHSIVQEEVEAERKRVEAARIASQTRTFFIHFANNVHKISVLEDDDVAVLLEAAWKVVITSPDSKDVPADVRTTFDPSCVRLRNWDVSYQVAKEPYDLQQSKSVKRLGLVHYKHICIEFRGKDQEFPQYDPQAIQLKVFYVKPEDTGFNGPVTVSVRRTASIAQLKREISRHPQIQIPVENIRIFKFQDYAQKTQGEEFIGDVLSVTSGANLMMHSIIYAEYSPYNVFEKYYEELQDKLITEQATDSKESLGKSSKKSVHAFDDTRKSFLKPFKQNNLPPNALESVSTVARPNSGHRTSTESNHSNRSSTCTRLDALSKDAFIQGCHTISQDGLDQSNLKMSEDAIVLAFAKLVSKRAYGAALRSVSSDDDSLAKQLYDDQLNKIQIAYAGLHDKIATSTLVVDRRITIGELRQRFAFMFNLPLANIVLYKSRLPSSSIRPDTKTLAQAGIFANTHVFVREGQQLSDGEFLISVELAQLPVVLGTKWIKTRQFESVMDTKAHASSDTSKHSSGIQSHVPLDNTKHVIATHAHLSSNDIDGSQNGSTISSASRNGVDTSDYIHTWSIQNSHLGWVPCPPTIGSHAPETSSNPHLLRPVESPNTSDLEDKRTDGQDENVQSTKLGSSPGETLTNSNITQSNTDKSISDDKQFYPTRPSRHRYGTVQIVATQEMLREEVCQRIFDEATRKDLLPDFCKSSHHLRLRAKGVHTIGSIIPAKSTLKRALGPYWHDQLEIIAEVLPEEEFDIPNSDEVLLYCCWWDRARWLLTTPREFYMSRHASFASIADAIANEAKIPKEHIQCTITGVDPDKLISHLQDNRWSPITERVAAVGSTFLHDGDFLLLSDFRVSLTTPPIKETNVSFAYPYQHSTFTPLQPVKKQTRKERGLKIYLKSERSTESDASPKVTAKDDSTPKSIVKNTSTSNNTTTSPWKDTYETDNFSHQSTLQAQKQKQRQEALAHVYNFEHSVNSISYASIDDDEENNMDTNMHALFEDLM